ncbi:hypothetical protein HELRODRAFT_177753 [Helobdella robusta]|uniref:Uncharacterized protein n=1 Tax=Helobdella robusta TaxID=6412 RepID=T1FC71_HELRO|nr:hypothetical protein HELRODRAFT_177753 [Helobdella robusta]ESN97698.1 hypothetical protein HELRODRAFT_177753 [Helobdella robusta]
MKKSNRSCLNEPDNFCYICGQFTPRDQRKNLSNRIKIAYYHYFGVKVADQERTWAPHICCSVCYVGLTQWLNGKRKQIPFAIPMIWREPRDHHSDCYFCMTNIQGHSKKTKASILYPNCSSAIKPVPHSVEYPVPTPPTDTVLYSEEEQSGDEKVDVEYKPDYDKDKPYMITQGELSDLVRDLGLTKNKAELLWSRLQQWNLLDRGTKISHFRDRHTEFAKFYNKEDNICYCVDIAGLMTKLDDEYDPVDWRLFIDSSKVSLKAVLLHNGNVKPSIPVAHAVGMKETYESMKTLLKVIKYTDHNWNISGDLKVVALLLGMQLGYTKHMCFLCLWNSRDDANHYLVKDWPARIDPVPGQFNILHESLVNPDKIFLPPLHIKLGIFKNFVKALPTDSKGFIYLKDKFKTTLTNAKIAAGVFTGPQIREVIRDPNFKLQLEPVELLAWEAFVALVQNFLGNHRSEDYVNLVENFIMAYQNMGCRMSLKIHFLHSHLSFFPANLGAVSDEQGERFHQEISVMEHRYQGRFDSNMMGDFCWFLQRESESQYKRKRSLSTNYFY